MKKLNIEKIISILENEVKSYRVPVVDLIKMQTNDPFKVLVTTILSARTTDDVTRRAAEKLFEKITTIGDLEKMTESEIAAAIYPVGFYKNKAKFLHLLPTQLKTLYNSKIPDDVESLTKLPGVGRKTANLVVAVAYNKPAICVDTHVHRITNIWGYVKTKTPTETEQALRKKLPQRHWITFNSILVAFGQHTCTPVSPKCSICVITDYCPKIGVKHRR